MVDIIKNSSNTQQRICVRGSETRNPHNKQIDLINHGCMDVPNEEEILVPTNVWFMVQEFLHKEESMSL